MKVKIIDILNRVAQEKNVPKKIKYYGVTYELQIKRLDYVDVLDYVDDKLNYLFDNVLRYGDYLFQHLNDEVEILDNKTDEIEELTEIEYQEINGVGDEHDQYVLSDNQKYICEAYDDVELVVIRKINELVRAVNKIQKEQVLIKSLNIISDCDKETNCMTD